MHMPSTLTCAIQWNVFKKENTQTKETKEDTRTLIREVSSFWRISPL